MDKESVAWAAGLFEGEGCIIQRRHSVDMTITSTDEDVIRRWGAVVGYGRMYGPYHRKNGHKSVYQWNIGRHEHVRAVYELFKPWLGERRTARFEEALQWQPKKKRRSAVSECGFYAAPMACSRGYLLHLSKDEGPCPTCRQSHRKFLKGEKAERPPEFYLQIVRAMKDRYGEAWRERWPDYVPFTVDGQPTAEPAAAPAAA